VHLTNGIGETALHFLAVENDLAGVAWLWARGADLDTKNQFGTPAVFEVAALEYKELFSWFVAQGVNMQAVDENGHDIVQHLLDNALDSMAEWVRENGV
jgi:hypothetical protein